MARVAAGGQPQMEQRPSGRPQQHLDRRAAPQVRAMRAPGADDPVGPQASVANRPKPSARARLSQRSTEGSFRASVAVDGLSITNSSLGPAGSQTRVRDRRYLSQSE